LLKKLRIYRTDEASIASLIYGQCENQQDLLKNEVIYDIIILHFEGEMK